MDYPIDERFLDADHNAPFERCLVCDKNVLSSGTDYFIERIFRRLSDAPEQAEVIFEYAMCSECAEQLRESLSKSSRARIEALFTERLAGKQIKELNESTLECLLTDKPISQAQEFSFHAHCRGDRLVHSLFPYAISDDGMDEISALLSNETLDMLDDFKGRYFSGPPEVAELLNPKRFVPL